jgi:hypothetical protein
MNVHGVREEGLFKTKAVSEVDVERDATVTRFAHINRRRRNPVFFQVVAKQKVEEKARKRGRKRGRPTCILLLI